jgi:hypothetical protein
MATSCEFLAYNGKSFACYKIINVVWFISLFRWNHMKESRHNLFLPELKIKNFMKERYSTNPEMVDL